MRLNRNVSDKLANVDSKTATHAAMGLISYIQDHPPEVQVAALAATFILVCEHLGISPPDAFGYTSRMMAFAEATGRLEYKAIRQYLENET